MPTVDEMFYPDDAPREQLMSYWFGKSSAVIWFLAKRLSDKDFEEYIRDLERTVHLWFQDLTRERDALRRIGLSDDLDALQFSMKDLLAVQDLVLEYTGNETEEWMEEMDAILKLKKSSDKKLAELKKYRKDIDPKRDRLFRRAMTIHEACMRAGTVTKAISYTDALERANEENRVYSYDEFDRDFLNIDDHFRQWRRRKRKKT